MSVVFSSILRFEADFGLCFILILENLWHAVTTLYFTVRQINIGYEIAGIAIVHMMKIITTSPRFAYFICDQKYPPDFAPDVFLKFINSTESYNLLINTRIENCTHLGEMNIQGTFRYPQKKFFVNEYMTPPFCNLFRLTSTWCCSHFDST